MNMKRNFLLALLLAVIVFSTAAACAAAEDVPLWIMDAQGQKTPMSIAEYRELNRTLTEAQVFPGLSEMTGDESFILFAAYVAMYETGDWGEQGSKEAVEAILNRYFGVEKINHDRSELYRSWPDWDVDYPLDGVSPSVWDWVNVTELQSLGDGMFLANADKYMGGTWDDSFLGPVSQWNLNSDIVEGTRDAWGDVYETYNVIRFGKCTLTLKPIVHNGENTWQIVAINGFEAPRILFP